MPEQSELLDTLQNDTIGNCTRCDLCRERTNVVFGTGDASADIMLVGEGPGQNEDEKGGPFVGRAGYALSKLLGKVGVEREDVYIANVVKCRPPNNRDPKPAEIKACWPFLREQISIVDPKVIIALGRFASNLLVAQGLTMSALREESWTYQHNEQKIWVVPTYHPAWLLRQEGDKKKPAYQKVLADIQKAQLLIQEELPPDDETEDFSTLFGAEE